MNRRYTLTDQQKMERRQDAGYTQIRVECFDCVMHLRGVAAANHLLNPCNAVRLYSKRKTHAARIMLN